MRLSRNESINIRATQKACELCGKITERLDIHHVDGLGQADNPNHGRSNLMVLCRRCHKREDMQRRKMEALGKLKEYLLSRMRLIPLWVRDPRQVFAETREIHH